MKKITSIKTRITIWYASLMFILMLIVLMVVGTLSYQLTTDNIKKDVILRVTQVSEKLSKRQLDVFQAVEKNREFKNVSIYNLKGEYIVGQYLYDVSNIEFKSGRPRNEMIDGREYIVYDVLNLVHPGARDGFWIRGIESVNSTMLLGRSAINVILITIPVILILISLGGYYITKKAFLPVNNIIETANDISTQNDITKRIEINPLSKQDEIYNLSITLNKMLDKIENLINTEKQFTSDASHELRTPISVILAQGEYLLDISKDEKERELAENIVTKSKQVTQLLSKLLLLSRIDQNRQSINKEKIDICVIVDIAIDSLRELANKKNISIISKVAEGTIIEADETLLLSAITNLINNAIKYGKEDGKVIISSSNVDDRLEILIKDDGIGISKHHINNIWERFYRVDDVRNDEYESNGLGLSMVKSIIELHGGMVSVKSKLGKGTEFKITLYNKK